MKRKLSLGPWVEGVFRLLVAMRRLRGTPLDPFGFAKVRRVERALVAEYRGMVERALRDLAPERHERAVRVARLPDLVRGYEEHQAPERPAFPRRGTDARRRALTRASRALMDLRQLEVFAGVYELRSFSRTASALRLTQSTVSEHVRLLEEELGTRLFDRLSRETVPTRAGELLYGYARQML